MQRSRPSAGGNGPPQQLRDLEQSIREEAMSEEARRGTAVAAAAAAIHQEARRRLGLPEEGTMSNYDTDFYAWTQDQAAALRARGEDPGLDHLAEEIEDVGNRSALPSRASWCASSGLLKLRYDPPPGHAAAGG